MVNEANILTSLSAPALTANQIKLNEFLKARHAKMEAMVTEGKCQFIAYDTRLADEWALQGVTSIAQWEAYWEVVEAQERAKDERNSW